IREASLMRTVNRAPEAVALLAKCRTEFEPKLQQQQKEGRSEWIPLLQYEHALALKDTGKIAEARAIFDGIVKQFEKRPEAAHALWRAAQCRREELLAALAAARAIPMKPGVKPEEIAAATK